jgi:cyanate permease
LRLPAVRILLAMSVGIFTINHGLNNWLPALLQSRGMSAASAGHWAVIPTVIGLAGSLLIPRLATPSRRHLVLAGLCASAMLATLLLLAESTPLMVIGLALQGIARSSMMTVAMLTLVETPGIGERHAATASGMFFSAAEVGGASGPVLVGLIHDASAGFGPSLGFLSAIAALLVVAALWLRRISRGERSDQPAVVES